MTTTRRQFVGGIGATMAALLAACGNQQTADTAQPTTTSATTTSTATSALSFDAKAWRYNADDNVYYQLGIAYCEKPADSGYEQLAVFVPGAYFDATDNGDGTYTCTAKASASSGNYQATNAPIVMPINTPGYSAQSPLDAYQSFTSYTNEGFVYVHAGCRGRDHGAPAGVTDLKAAVRFLRLAGDKLPGNKERIFTFGHSGGGAQSALMGATGDALEYEPYLEAIGAVTGVSDAIYGSMDWCPITNLDSADAAYEWMMGCTRSGLGTDEQAISDGLAKAYASYVNAAGFVDDAGKTLELTDSTSGFFQAGSYYDYVKAAIETSLNNFLADTSFPYDASNVGGMGHRAGMGGAAGGAPGAAPSGEPPQGGEGSPGADAAGSMSDAESRDNISRTQTSGGVQLSGSYETVDDYVAALNADTAWVTYDAATKTATITSVADFCVALKQASKSLGAFDQLDRGQGENTLFGYGDGNGAHFDQMLAKVLEDVGSSYAADYAEDLAKTDELGNAPAARLAMYTPLYYLLKSEQGYGKSVPAKHWRIRTGITQGDTALTCELNLALALRAYSAVESVDFASVWGLGHTQAERSGSADENFIAWVKQCM